MWSLCVQMLSGRPLTLQPNLLSTHPHLNRSSGAVQPADENSRPQLLATSGTLLKAGQQLLGGHIGGGGGGGNPEKVQVYCDTNKENAPVAKSTRSRLGSAGLSASGLLLGPVPTSAHAAHSTATATAGMAQLNQKPRRVLQEIRVSVKQQSHTRNAVDQLSSGAGASELSD